ncbi:MAG: hypothetical protein LJE68_07695 [Rhodobacter sp.]|nr:hypothetical protein [Rhodobacter sp.]
MTAPAAHPVFDRRVLLLALIPPLVYAVVNWVLIGAQSTLIAFETLPRMPQGTASASLAAPRADIAGAALEYRFRMFWISAFLISVSIALLVGISAALSVWRNTPRRDRGLVFGLAATAFGGFVIAELGFTGDRWYANLGEGLFRGLYSTADAGAFKCRGDAACSLIAQLDTGLDLAKYSGGFALIMLTLAFAMTLSTCVGDDRDRANRLARSVREQQSLLYQGALVYGAAVVAMIAWMSWPLPHLTAASADAYREVLIGAAAVQGVGFTLGIASIFLPASILLRHRAQSMAEAEAEDTAEQQEWLKRCGFDGQIRNRAAQAAAMLLPAGVSLFPAITDWFG